MITGYILKMYDRKQYKYISNLFIFGNKIRTVDISSLPTLEITIFYARVKN